MDLGVLVGIIGGILVILGAIMGIVGFFIKLGGRIAIAEKTLSENVVDTTAAHDKIRKVADTQAQHTTDIAVLKTSLDYIKDGIDDIRAAVAK